VRKEFGSEVGALPWGARVRDPDAMDLITIEDVTSRLDQFFASSTQRRQP
jgi:heptosyltransferase I